MKFLTTLGFFASAMALTTSPVKKSNPEQPGLYDLVVATPGYVNTRREPNSGFNLAHMFSLLSYRQEPEAVSSHERLRRVTFSTTVCVPYVIACRANAVASVAGITISFTLSKVRQWAFLGVKKKVGRLCTEITLHNPTNSNFIINIMHSGSVIWRNRILPMGQKMTIEGTQPYSGEDLTVIASEA